MPSMFISGSSTKAKLLAYRCCGTASKIPSMPPFPMASGWRLYISKNASISNNMETFAPNHGPTHLIFFFPSNRLLREATVRPAGRGGGGAASGARERTWVIDGVSGDGIDGRPSAPGVGPAATSVSRRRGVPRTSKLVATAGRTEDASGAGRVGARPRRLLLVAPASPFELLGSSSASGSASWSESTAAVEAETALALFLETGFVDFDLGLDLPSAVCGSAVGS